MAELDRIGNSLRITVSIEVVRALEWQEGDKLEIGLTDSKMRVKKAENEYTENFSPSLKLKNADRSFILVHVY